VTDGTHSSPHDGASGSVADHLDELSLLRSENAALKQLLEVHEQTSLEQATRLEQSVRERDELLARERRAREMLIESEQRLRLALDAGRMGTWEWDIVGGRVIWSPEEERLYGLTPGSFSGSIDEYRDRIHPDDREMSLKLAMDALQAHASTHHVLHRIVREDGAVRWLDSHARFMYADDGRPLRLVGVSTDVTEQRQFEEALREREEEFRTLANSIPQLAWMTDANGAIMWYNQRWYDYTGTNFEQMRGWGWRAVHHPQHVDQVVQRFTDTIAHGEAWEDTFPLRGRDGQYRWFLSRALPIRNAEGQITRWFGTNTDVTERLEIEAARDRALDEAKAERQRLYEVFMQAPAAIAVLEGPDHVFVVANPLYAELVGGRAVLGRTVAQALPEVVGQGFLDLLGQVYRTGEPFVAREMCVQLDRHGTGVLEELYVDFVYQPLKTPAGETFGIMVHAVEVTSQVRARQEIEQKADELQRLTRELERSNKELDQFAYVASHDLKAPLRGIANLTQWLEEDLGDRVTGESREHMQLLKGRVHRMEALIDGILAYSRAGRVRERPGRVDLSALLAEVVELLSPPADTQVVVAPDMPVMEAERVPLQQIFMNLIGNAIKYVNRPDGRVEIRAERENDFYRFAVADNGPGIAPQYQEKIWQIFQTLAPRDKVEGTGIGLSVVRKIVEARGGRAWVESEPGQGSTFYFTWPVHQEYVP
jgi:PAS domain S-box-containing protein